MGWRIRMGRERLRAAAGRPEVARGCGSWQQQERGQMPPGSRGPAGRWCGLSRRSKIALAGARPIHPGWLRRSSLTYRRVCSLLAPCHPGASAALFARAIFSRLLTGEEKTVHAATLLVELVRVRFHDQRPQAIGGFVEHRHPERFGSRQRSGVAPPSAVRFT